MREDLSDVVEVFYRQNRPAIILLPTNGLLPEVVFTKTQEILERCPRSVVTVKLSLDGLEEVHDQLRGVSGAFQKCLSTHRQLAGLVEQYENFELGINTVFCSRNQDCMEDIVNYVSELRAIKTHTVSLIRGDVRDQGLKQVNHRKYQEVIDMLATNLRSKKAPTYRFRGGRIKAAQDIVQRQLIHQTQTQQTQLVPCFAGQLTAVVTESGDVYPCESFTGKMGNVREAEYDLGRILVSEKGSSILAAIQEKKCFCSHECYMMMNILFNFRSYPEICREYLKLTG